MTYERNVGQQKMRQLFTSGKRYNLVYGGSRSGKTFEVIGTILERALLAAGSRHLIVRQEGTSVKRAIVKGTWPEVVALRWTGMDYHWNEQYGYFTLPNGSEVWVGGLNDDKSLEKILGNEYDTIYVNEASEVKYLAFTLLRSRLANMTDTLEGVKLSQRFYVDLNPTTRQHWTYRLWMDGVDPDTDTNVDISQYGSVIVNPYDNKDNLSPEYIKDLESLPPAARKRFLEGEYVADAEHALWRRETIHRTQKPPELTRIVVAIDPAVSNQAGSDETGLVVTAIDAGGNGYVLCDDSGKYRPEEWARRAIGLYHQFNADRIVAEVNQGGDMVENTVRAIDADIPYRAVRATRGKYVRAEPVAALYERGLVYHVGVFDNLEDQMCSFTTDLNRKVQGYSPDRVDALVWGFTELFPQMAKRTEDTEVYIPQPYSAFT